MSDIEPETEATPPKNGQNPIMRLVRLLVVLALAMGFVTLCAVAALALVFRDKQSDQNQFLAQSEANGRAVAEANEALVTLSEQVTSLETDLGNARGELEAERARDRAAETARSLADDCIDFASARLDISVADLIAALAGQRANPDPDALVNAVAGVDEAKDYLVLVIQRRPEDCPPTAG